MICSKCRAIIEEGSIFCPECGHTIQLVPDYNLVDEVVHNSVSKEHFEEEMQETVDTASQPEMDTAGKKELNAVEKKEKKKPKKKKPKKRKKRRVWIFWTILLALILAGFGAAFYIWDLQEGSYDYQIKQANKCIESKKYGEAMDYLKRAVELDTEAPEPLLLMSDVYLAEDEKDTAVHLIKRAISLDDENEEAYERLIFIYEIDGDYERIYALLKKASESIRTAFYSYLPDIPQFGLEEGVYNDIQNLKIVSVSGEIYYTLDDTTPDEYSFLYTEPIVLEEGITTVRAVTISEMGVISEEIVATYEIELSLPNPPLVSPGTGKYEFQTDITITVPEGCTVYYTLDGSDPDTDSAKYEEPIPMKEGNYIFSAVVVDENERMSGITRRNYELVLRNE